MISSHLHIELFKPIRKNRFLRFNIKNAFYTCYLTYCFNVEFELLYYYKYNDNISILNANLLNCVVTLHVGERLCNSLRD